MIEYPCQFPIKIMFKNKPGTVDELLAIVRRHHPELLDTSIQQQSSKNGNYGSITVTVEAKNQEALDALYLELTQHPNIKMVL